MEMVYVASCLVECQSDITCISVKSSAVLRSLRALENMTGQALLQIMPWFSWFVSCLITEQMQTFIKQ